jgi:hypothetical protein
MQWRMPAAFWDVAPCGFCENRCFWGPYRLHHQVERISELGAMLAVTSNWSTLILSTLMMEAILRNVGFYKIHMASHSRRRSSSWCMNCTHLCQLLWKREERRFVMRLERTCELGKTLARVTANVVLGALILSPWWWRRYVPPKGRFLQDQNEVFVDVVAPRYSDLGDGIVNFLNEERCLLGCYTVCLL